MSTTADVADLLVDDAPAYVQQAFYCIAYDHESGGDPTAVNPSSGDGGLYQFNPTTWANVIATAGGSGFPSLAQDASVAQQDTVAYWAWQQAGFGPWAGDDECWE